MQRADQICCARRVTIHTMSYPSISQSNTRLDSLQRVYNIFSLYPILSISFSFFIPKRFTTFPPSSTPRGHREADLPAASTPAWAPGRPRRTRPAARAPAPGVRCSAWSGENKGFWGNPSKFPKDFSRFPKEFLVFSLNLKLYSIIIV